jgi:hypothetical protein
MYNFEVIEGGMTILSLIHTLTLSVSLSLCLSLTHAHTCVCVCVCVLVCVCVYQRETLGEKDRERDRRMDIHRLQHRLYVGLEVRDRRRQERQ